MRGHRDVPHLARRAGRAAPQPPAEHEPGGDEGTDCDRLEDAEVDRRADGPGGDVHPPGHAEGDGDRIAARPVDR